MVQWIHFCVYTYFINMLYNSPMHTCILYLSLLLITFFFFFSPFLPLWCWVAGTGRRWVGQQAVRPLPWSQHVLHCLDQTCTWPEWLRRVCPPSSTWLWRPPDTAPTSAERGAGREEGMEWTPTTHTHGPVSLVPRPQRYEANGPVWYIVWLLYMTSPMVGHMSSLMTSYMTDHMTDHMTSHMTDHMTDHMTNFSHMTSYIIYMYMYMYVL